MRPTLAHLCDASSSLLLRLSLQAARTGAQTITVIMESHVLLWRMRPADWLTAGALRASCTSNRETGRGESEGGETARRKRKKKKTTHHQKAARRRIHLSSPLLDKLSHLRFHTLPLSGSFTISPSPPPSRPPPRSSTEWYIPCLQTLLLRYWLRL